MSDNPEKLEETRKCLATLAKLRMQITGLKNLRLDGLEMQYAEPLLCIRSASCPA